MKLIVGLGNPGAHYEGTRHNVGFMVLSRLADRHQVSWSPRSFWSIYGDWQSRDTVRLLKPHAMMNQSGKALEGVLQEWDVNPSEMLIVCDDVNLPLGVLRLRPSGSDGGHHGLASCLEALGSQDVPRLRVGVGIEPLPKELTDFVLSPFTAQERAVVDGALARAVEACEAWATQGIEVAMNMSNMRP